MPGVNNTGDQFSACGIDLELRISSQILEEKKAKWRYRIYLQCPVEDD
jgi:hypothetical protein